MNNHWPDIDTGTGWSVLDLHAWMDNEIASALGIPRASLGRSDIDLADPWLWLKERE